MENMKSLADQIREQLSHPAPAGRKGRPEKAEKKPGGKVKVPAILTAIQDYDNTENKSMVHVRFNEKTVRTMNQFKMATGVDVTKLVAFSVKHLFESFPEIKNIIKQFIQNSDL
ncbi:hypothetical protein [Mucilaginibacter sp. HD30]